MAELPKVSIAVIGVVVAQIGGFIWWTAQQASTIASLEETVSELSAQSEVQDKVNMQRDILANKNEIDNFIKEVDEIWDDIEMVWEDLDGMTAHMMEILRLQSRISILENTVDLMGRVRKDAM